MNVPTLDRTQLNNRGNGFPFFDPATAKKDCNVAKVSEAIEYFNGHRLTAQWVRRVGGYPGSVPTGNTLAQRVFQSEGMVKGTDFILAGKRPLADLHAYLRDGWYVGGYIDYGVATSVDLPSGDKKYTGAHCIGIWGWRRSKTGILVWDHDPLFDGRRAAIPYGRQHVNAAKVFKAMEALAGADKWSGWAVKIPL